MWLEKMDDNSRVIHAYKVYSFGHKIGLPSYISVTMSLHLLSMYQLYSRIGEAMYRKERRKKWPSMISVVDKRLSSILKCALDYTQNK